MIWVFRPFSRYATNTLGNVRRGVLFADKPGYPTSGAWGMAPMDPYVQQGDNLLQEGDDTGLTQISKAQK